MDFGELNELNGRSRNARKAENTYKWETLMFWISFFLIPKISIPKEVHRH